MINTSIWREKRGHNANSKAILGKPFSPVWTTMVELYHYTDKAGLDGILREGVIRASRGGKYGPGVYLTDLNPHHYDKAEIALVNYGVGARKNLTFGKVDHHVALTIPAHKVNQVDTNTYLFSEGALELSRYSHGSGDNTEWIAVAAAVVVASAILIPAAEMLYRGWTFMWNNWNDPPCDSRGAIAKEHRYAYSRSICIEKMDIEALSRYRFYVLSSTKIRTSWAVLCGMHQMLETSI